MFSMPFVDAPRSLAADGMSDAAPDAARDVADSASGLSAEASQWLGALARPDSWVIASQPGHHAEFLGRLTALALEAGVFPSGTRLLVSWSTMNRIGATPVFYRMFHVGEDAVATMESASASASASPDRTNPPEGIPWLCVYVEYDGQARLARGTVVEGLKGPTPALIDNQRMSSLAVGALLATLARECHERRGSPVPEACRDAASLREAMVRSCADRRDIVEKLARDFPLGDRFLPPIQSEQLVAIANRATQALVHRGSIDTAAEFLIPAEVMRVLLDPRIPSPQLNLRGQGEVARRLKLSPTVMRLNFGRGGCPTLLGRQSARPGLARRHWDAGAEQILGDRQRHGVGEVRALHKAGYRLAEGLLLGALNPDTVRAASWWGPECDPG